MSSPAELSASELPMDSTLTGPVLIIGSGLLGASIGLGLCTSKIFHPPPRLWRRISVPV